MKNIEIKLRAHHGCALLSLRERATAPALLPHGADSGIFGAGNPTVTVVAEADCICGSCPNLTDGRCRKAALVEHYDKAVLALCGMGERSSLPWREFAARVQNIFFPKEGGAKSAAAVNGVASAKKKRLCTVCDFYGRINKR